METSQVEGPSNVRNQKTPPGARERVHVSGMKGQAAGTRKSGKYPSPCQKKDWRGRGIYRDRGQKWTEGNLAEQKGGRSRTALRVAAPQYQHLLARENGGLLPCSLRVGRGRRLVAKTGKGKKFGPGWQPCRFPGREHDLKSTNERLRTAP